MTEKEQLYLEVDTITDAILRDFVKGALDRAPEKFWLIPASSTGKHHPEQSNGEGGLVRHILACLYFGREFCIAYCADDNEKDIVTAGIILHDIGKAMAEPHDIVNATQLRWDAKDKKADSYIVLQAIHCARWHMGRWATGSTDCQADERGEKKFPEGFSRVEQIVHVADYAASRKRVNLTKLGGLS